MQCAVESQKGVFCSNHPDEECTFVCGLCNMLICDDCIDSTEHTDHGVTSIKNFIKEVDLDELQDSCKDMEGQKIRQQALGESEKQIQRAVDAINSQASYLISEINRIKESKIQECENKKLENLAVVNSVVSLIDTSSLSEKINNLPKKGGRSKYAEVAYELLNFQRNVESDDFESKCEGVIYVPKFTAGKVKTARLEKIFGNVEFEEEDVDDLFGSGSDSTDISDDNGADSDDSAADNEEEKGSDFQTH